MFRELFLPDGQPPLSGLFTRRLDLAAILDRVAAGGISEFYSGNLSQEVTTAVKPPFTSTYVQIIVHIIIIIHNITQNTI